MMKADFFSSEYQSIQPPYSLVTRIGKGSYGEVVLADCLRTGDQVAIKKLANITENHHLLIQSLRELKLMRLLNHESIISAREVLMPENPRGFQSVYVVMDKMDCDLHSLIAVNVIPLDVSRDIMYQVLRGIRYLHLHKVLHRDVKPMNILISLQYRCAKLCDLGMARIDTGDKGVIFWTDYVATRWYRSPELTCSYFSRHSPGIDMWAVGCVFAEIAAGQPLFPGKNLSHQIQLMTDIMGTPTSAQIDSFRSEKARRLFESMPSRQRRILADVMPEAQQDMVDMLEMLLVYDLERPSAETMLRHRFFSKYHENGQLEAELAAEVANPLVSSKAEWRFESLRKAEPLRQAMLDEICLWNQVNSIRIDDSAETPGKSHVDKFRERALD